MEVLAMNQTEDQLAGPDNLVRLFIYNHFLDQGRPPTAFETAEALDLAGHEAEASFSRLAEGHYLALAPGSHQIWMAHPFSALATDYQVRIGSKEYWAN
jgi:hypothetical protein